MEAIWPDTGMEVEDDPIIRVTFTVPVYADKMMVPRQFHIQLLSCIVWSSLRYNNGWVESHSRQDCHVPDRTEKSAVFTIWLES